MPKRRVFLAAVDRYPNPANNLPSCVADATAFERMLRTTYGFADPEIRSVYDEKATLENVQAGLTWLLGNAEAGDSLVFFFSGHGYQVRQAESLEEVLCLHDKFLFDNELSERTRSLPEGVFTLICDSCHSGGAYKVVAFGDNVEIVQNKVLKVPPPDQEEKVFLHPAHLSGLRYRPFGARPNSWAAIARKIGGPIQKGADEEGQLAMSGVLMAACQENETASASTAKTNRLSAFTFALLEQLKAATGELTNRGLMTATTAMLQQLGFRQTPLLMASPAALADRPFLGLPRAGKSTDTVGAGASEDAIARAVAEAIRNAKEKSMVTDVAVAPASTSVAPMPATTAQPAASSGGDEKFWGAIASIAQVAIPAVLSALRKGGFEPQKDFQAAPGGQDKFWGALANVVATVAPAVIQALRKGDFNPQKDFEAMPGGEEKFWMNYGRLSSAILRTLPMRASIELQKGDFALDKSAGGEDKFWGALAGIVASAVPAVIQALQKSGAAPKGFEDTAGQDKFWGALASVVATTLPSVISALRKGGFEPQKDFQDEAGQQKFWGALASTVGSLIPVVVQALRKGDFDVQKDFGGEEKFWGAFGNMLRQALPVVLNAVGGGAKGGFEKAPEDATATGDDKFWRALARVAASAVPAIVGELTKGDMQEAQPAAAPTAAKSDGQDQTAVPPAVLQSIIASQPAAATGMAH